MWWYAYPLALGAGMYLFVRHRQRRLGVDAWQTKWKSLPKERRKQIWSAVKQGRALPDPDDAALAVEAIDASTVNPLAPRRRSLRRLLAWTPLVALAFLLADAHGDVRDLVVYGGPLLIFSVIGPIVDLLLRDRYAALQRARELNAEVALSAGRTTARTFEPPR
jgi:hypothetical protein